MIELRKILVAIDFSAHARRALERALYLAEPFRAQVDALHVGMPPTAYGPLDRAIFGEAHTEELTRRVRDAANQAMDAFFADLPEEQRKRVGRRIEWGTPYEVVTRVAEEGDYDLVVVGTHGRTGAKHVLIGSVAERIIRHAKCPVLAVR